MRIGLKDSESRINDSASISGTKTAGGRLVRTRKYFSERGPRLARCNRQACTNVLAVPGRSFRKPDGLHQLLLKLQFSSRGETLLVNPGHQPVSLV